MLMQKDRSYYMSIKKREMREVGLVPGAKRENSLEKGDDSRIDQLETDLSHAPRRFRCPNATECNRENTYNQLRNKSF
ncbi:hypothetical protein Y032_0266g690 [Ancylostoma ceylanicum]|uniref:Uncharacterized protein n=1 Tax=Ancylostoma ceylanicum TaxID=53326 RepID=A0A016S978_9BILA|nr:hypothetical protein Y032_0266g690 [Ancylostoma ceylanicum]